jgi:hypothetical protein
MQKRCYRCKKKISTKKFYPHLAHADKLSSFCIPCEKATRKAHYHKPEVKKRTLEIQRVRKYNVTPDAFEKQLKKQRNKCAICGIPNPRCLDHDHAKGKNRGILCDRCNWGLGHFRDSVLLLRKAIKYVEETAWHSNDADVAERN